LSCAFSALKTPAGESQPGTTQAWTIQPSAPGERPSAYRDRVGEMLELTGLAGKPDRFPSQLSGGEQQRVAVARALIRKPAVVLADEPTGNLDTKTGDSLLELFATCNKAGQSIVLVTHDPKVASAADRVLFMRDGAFVEEAPLKPHRHELAELVRMEDPSGSGRAQARHRP
jgi:putative ABC transport system ATP-binding protein